MKGVVYTIETLFVVAIISTALILAFNDQITQPQFDISLFKQAGWDALDYLYYKGDLRILVAKNISSDVNASLYLKNAFNQSIPQSMDFAFDICTKQCSATLPPSRNVISIDYYIEGRKIKLWIFRKEI